MKIVKIFAACLLLSVVFFNINKSNNIKEGTITLDQILRISSASAEDAQCASHPDAFCKNKPSINDGYCIEGIGQVCCKESSVQNVDCYDIGL